MLRPVSNPGLLKVLSIVFFVFFIINFAASFSEIVDVVTSEDLNRVWIDHKMIEDSSWLNILPPPTGNIRTLGIDERCLVDIYFPGVLCDYHTKIKEEIWNNVFVGFGQRYHWQYT